MQIEGETVETMAHFILGGAPKSLEMVMDREAWRAVIQGVAKGRT